MIIAILFNSDHPKYNFAYGRPIRDLILSSHILQSSNRHLKISLGDVLIFSHAKTREEFIKLSEITYFALSWKKLKSEHLRSTYNNQTVFAWVIQNVTKQLALDLHKYLYPDDAYLGMHEVDFSYPIHLALYRQSMILKYRIYKDACNQFYSMGNEDEKDPYEIDEVKKNGFVNVSWEDKGARQTIFDDYDTLDHFRQITEFEQMISSQLDNEDDAGELSMLIEDLSPKLFNALGAASRSLSRAQNEEDYAHVGLSIRRYMEQLSDTLFPPRNELFNGRKVGKSEYKNRIWAFIDSAIPVSDLNRRSKLESLGKSVDKVIVEANAALHSEKDKDRVIRCLADLAKLSIKLLSIDPEKSRNPYYAYSEKIIKFTQDL
jgi:hypothetical protein